MYFPASNHYFDDSYKYNSDNSDNNDCLICLEINDNSDNICIRIENNFYTKDCLCDGWIHEYCLHIWYVKNNKCPICLCSMIKNELTGNEIQENEIQENEIQIENTNNISFIIHNLHLLMKYMMLVYCFLIFIFIFISYYNIENMVIKN